MATATKKTQAARVVRDGAGSARIQRRAAADRPVDLVARRAAAIARDDSDAERWLDEGGSFSSEAVARWPVGTLIAPEASVLEISARRIEYRCECGHALHVFGGGRHRLYFEPGNESLGDPVMNRVCPQCGRGLPGKNRP